MSRRLVPAALVLSLLVVGSASDAAPNTRTRRVNLTSDGNEATGGYSLAPVISNNGRYVAFASYATNLVANDQNNESDVFVRDRATGKTRRVSVKSNGDEGAVNLGSGDPDISDNGRYIVFDSLAGLVNLDDNGERDVYIHDRRTKKTRRVSLKSNGDEAEIGGSYGARISGNGKVVAFTSADPDLVPGDDNSFTDVFVRVLATGKTTRVSVKSNGNEAEDNDSYSPSLSRSGRLVAFTSADENLVPGDDNMQSDVFTHDRETKKTRRISVQSDGDQATLGSSSEPNLSASGRIVSYESHAVDLVPSDGNEREDIFVYDRVTKKTRIVSVNAAGNEGDDSSEDSDITPDGRFVAFESRAENLVASDDNAQEDCFFYDLKTKRIRRVNLRNSGQQTYSGSSDDPALSADAKFVVFESEATDLIGQDTNTLADIFVRGPLR